VVACIVDSSLIASWLLVLLTPYWSEMYVVVNPVCYVKYTTDIQASFRLRVLFHYWQIAARFTDRLNNNKFYLRSTRCSAATVI